MKETIYRMIEPGEEGNTLADWYDYFMIIVITLSLIPLLFKTQTGILNALDVGTAIIFAADYALRWMTADLKLGMGKLRSFIRYPFTLMAIIDLISLMPVLSLINPAFKLFRFTRLIRALRVLRVLRAFRYSRNIRIIINVFRRRKEAFLMVLILTVGYIFITAAILFQIEPRTFDNFFDAIYWAVILLTTVGYGDVVAVTVLGKVITIVSALMGIAVVALPAGLIVAGYLEELEHEKKNEEEDR